MINKICKFFKNNKVKIRMTLVKSKIFSQKNSRLNKPNKLFKNHKLLMI